MNASIHGNIILITLSERNLKTLVKASEIGVNPDLYRRIEDGKLLIVQVESDEKHYKDASEARKLGSKEIRTLLEHGGAK